MPNVNYTNRKFTRVLFEAPVILEGDDVSWTSRIIDISLKGILIEKPENWPDVSAGKFLGKIMLTDEIKIEMNLTIAHSDEKVVGLRCDHIDLDSASHLRRLVELNLGDSKMLEREIGALLGARAI